MRVRLRQLTSCSQTCDCAFSWSLTKHRQRERKSVRLRQLSSHSHPSDCAGAGAGLIDITGRMRRDLPELPVSHGCLYFTGVPLIHYTYYFCVSNILAFSRMRIVLSLLLSKFLKTKIYIFLPPSMKEFINAHAVSQTMFMFVWKWET